MLIDYEALSHADRRGLAGLHDSKQMSAERREELYPCVLRAAARVSVVVRCARGIDDRGLHVTNIEALSSALERLEPGERRPAWSTASRCAGARCPTAPWSEGDGTSAAIAAASVVAKVTRDRYMHGAARDYPGWGFEEHVGYSTPEHREAIERSASRRCTAAPSSRSPTRQLGASAVLERAPRMCSMVDARGPARSKVTPTASKRISP